MSLRIRVRDIQAAAAEVFGVPLDAMTTDNRRAAWAFPRQVAMHVAVDLTDQSWPEIAARFGGRDHTTLRHAYHEIASRRRRPGGSQLEIQIAQIKAGAARRAIAFRDRMRKAAEQLERARA